MSESLMDNDVMLNCGAALTEASRVEDTAAPYVLVPSEWRREDVEDTMQFPIRKRGLAKLRDVGSFVRYYKKHAGTAGEIYGDKQDGTFVAVFNGHTAGVAGWGDHRASYACPQSKEWLTWTGKSGRSMSQVDFAQFIEDNLPDIIEPAGADMLEVSRSLEATKKVQFAQSTRLNNGANELQYEETVAGTAAKGKLQIPETFTLGIKVFEGGEPYKVQARLRYRINENKTLLMWYELVRPHKIVEAAVNDVWKQIEEQAATVIFSGYPV